MSQRVVEPILVPCDHVVREAGTNKAHLHGVFDKVFVSALPAALDCWLYISFYLEDLEPGPCTLQLSLERPGGSVDLMPPVAFAVADSRVEGDMHLQQVPLLTPGIHRLVLSVGAARVASVRIYVDKVEGAQPARVPSVPPAGSPAVLPVGSPSRPPRDAN